MLKIILSIRLKQFVRLLNEVGIILLLLLLVVSIPMIAGALFHLTNLPPHLTAAIMILILFSIQINRKDKAFLQKLTPKAYWIFFTEYLLISVPILVFLIFRMAWLPVLMVLPAIFLVPLLNITFYLPQQRERPLFRLPKYFSQSYEWINGLRKNYFYFAILYPIALAFGHFTPTIMVVLFLISITTCDFYQNGEPRVFLELTGKSARSFLLRKIGWHLLIFWTACLPLVILFFIFHAQYWYILLIVSIVVSLFPVIAIVLKYASYQPDTLLSQNNIILAVMIAFLCFPFTQPVPLIMAIVYYRKAVKNLNFYFD